jgi:hypothetical protein
MNEIFYKFQELISDATVNNFLKALLEMATLSADFLPMAVETYLDIMEHFPNRALLKVASWVVAEFTHRISSLFITQTRPSPTLPWSTVPCRR